MVFLLGFFHFAKFYICAKEMAYWEEDFTYLYLEPIPGRGTAEENHKNQIRWESWNIGKKKELSAQGLSHRAYGYVIRVEGGRLGEWYLDQKKGSCVVSSYLAQLLFGTEKVAGKKIECQEGTYTIQAVAPYQKPIIFLNGKESQRKEALTALPEGSDANSNFEKGGFSAVMVSGMNPFNYQKVENLFFGYETKVDIRLLKWIFCFFGVLFFAGTAIHILIIKKKHRIVKGVWFLVLLLGFCYSQVFEFLQIEAFPLWALPGKWSDFNGWKSLWESIGQQIAYIIRFQDYPIIDKYYHGIIKGIFHLFLSFSFLQIFLAIYPIRVYNMVVALAKEEGLWHQIKMKIAVVKQNNVPKRNTRI